MVIKFTKDALEFINEKEADAVTVDMMVLGGCGGEHYTPAVSLGKPEALDLYDMSQVDGKTVYIYKDAEAKEGGIEISIEIERKYYKKIVVNGLKYDESSLD